VWAAWALASAQVEQEERPVRPRPREAAKQHVIEPVVLLAVDEAGLA
jgi:hypothetical protein